MKLCKETLETLKNFSTINSGVVLVPGTKQSTIADENNIVVWADIDEEIPVEIAIHDLPSFLGIISQLDAPDLDFQSKWVDITDNGLSVRYHYSNPELIKVIPQGKSLELTSVDGKFELTNSSLTKIIKIANSMDLPDVRIVGEGGKIYLYVVDSDVDTSNFASKEVGEYEGDDFELIIPVENLRLVPDDYVIEFSAKQFAEFRSKSRRYVLALKKRKN